MSDGSPQRITARWVFPIDSPPIERGLIEVTDGVISDVSVQRGLPDVGTLDLGNAAIIPGLINAHAHLEFADLKEPIQPVAPFTDWIQSLLSYRRERTSPLSELIAVGQQESINAGVHLVGDIVTGEWTPEFVRSTGPSVVAFRELIGLLPHQADAQIEIARHHITECRKVGGHLIPAISPHAPYSVSPDLFHRSIELAHQERVPLCIHLAETQAELQLLRDGTGELYEMLTAFGVWQDGVIPRESRPLDYLKPLAELDHALIAHGNYLTSDEINFISDHPNIAVVFCPRTHAYFGHSEHPWQRLLAAGATVCIGTDGRSSNPDYSLWAELQFLDRQTAGMRRPDLLRMATSCGADALAHGDRHGAIVPGRQQTMSVVDLPANDGEPWGLLFAASSLSSRSTL